VYWLQMPIPALGARAESDADLVKAARAGSLAAADRLLGRYWPRAWRTAYAVLGDRAGADDAAQSAVERAFRSLDQFDLRRPFGPWLAQIAANQALNAIRSRKRHVPLDEVVASGAEPVGPDAYADIAARDEVVRAVGNLQPERRVVVALRYWADLGPGEIAAALDVPIGTVTSRLSRALAELRAALEEVKS
jgi:RNA polymerase sigma-70 factor (ECF subfamily)